MEIQNETLLIKYARITGVVALYWVVSISMVFINKSLLGGSSMGEKDAPLFITWFQCVITVVVYLILSRLSKVTRISFPHVGFLEENKVKQVLPLSVMFVTMISTNNLCLKYVGVSFYYVGRSLTTVFNVFFTFVILRQKTTFGAIVCCGIIIGGFWLGIDQESLLGSLSVIGVIFGVIASASVSLNAIYTKKALPVFDGSVWLLTYYSNHIACILFIPLMLITGEYNPIAKLLMESDLWFWGMMCLSGICAIAIGYVAALQIQVTSPLTHNVSGTAKACAQTVLATWWFTELKPILWWISNAVVLFGSMAYTRVKQLEMKAQHAAAVNTAALDTPTNKETEIESLIKCSQKC